MTIKETKDEPEISKQDAESAKKTGPLKAAKIKKQLDESKTQIAALKSINTRAGVEKNDADAKLCDEITAARHRLLATPFDSHSIYIQEILAHI